MKAAADYKRAGHPIFRILAAVLVMALTGPAFSAAAAGPPQIMKAALVKAGVAMQVVPLERTDGFEHGLLISVPGASEMLVSLDEHSGRRFLVASGDDEAVVEIDDDGELKIGNQQTQEPSYLLCLVSSVITYADDISFCDSDDPVCYMLTTITFFQDILACDNGEEEPPQE